MMDRNREARRAAAMTNGGLPRRRHRTTTGSLRDSPEDDGPLDLQETARLRDRPAKKDRDRDRDRDRLNRSKRRRGVGDDTSDESVNDEEDDDDGPVRFAPPSNLVPMTSSSTATTLVHRKSYPPQSKVFRSAPVAPSCKTPEEMITFSVPRKARSVSTKRSHDCWSSGGGGDQIHRQASPSPVRSSMTAATTALSASPSPSPAPMSPSSSNVSIKKKLKPNGPKQKAPPRSCPKSSPSIQEEIEIEVAEVLYGLMRQSQAPSNDSAKLDRSTVDNKSGVLTTVAPKRKRPRPYPEEIPASRSCSIPSVVKVEADHPPKAEVLAPSTEETMLGSVVENGDLTNPHDPMAVQSSEAGNPTVVEAANGVVPDAKSMVEDSGVRDGAGRAKVQEASSSSKMESQDHNRVESTSTSNKANSAVAEKNQRVEKFEIDLMAPPPPSRGSPEREEEAEYGGGTMGDEKSMVPVTQREAEAKAKEEENEKGAKSNSSSRGVELNVKATEADAEVDGKAKAVATEGGPHKQPPSPRQHDHDHDHQQLNLNSKRRNIDLQLDMEKDEPPTLVNDNKLQPQQQPPPNATKDEADADNKPGQSSSVPLAMSVAAAGWHGGLGPMGYMAPLQGVVSMDGTPMPPPSSIQAPLFRFILPRPKRCATHSYVAKSIAKSIEAHQKMMKSNPFWPAAAAGGSAPLFGAKPYNLNMVPAPPEDKGQPFAFFPGQPASMDKSQQLANAPDSAHNKQFLLPQTLPPGAPTNVLHAPALFFPFGQQQAAAAASARPGAAKSPSTAGSEALSSAPMGTSSTATAVSGPTMSFSFPNMGANETQFMAILGNSPYPFPIPAHVGAAATPYRGSHPQAAMSFFNGSFYSPQMLHPSQLQQQQQQPQPAVPSQSYQIQQQNHQNPSSSSQKHVQNNQQQRPPQGSSPSPAPASNSYLQNFQAAKGRHDLGGGEDSRSTADSRTHQRPNLSVYAQNFAMPSFHSPNFGLMSPPSSNGSHGDKKQQQQQQTQQPAFPMSFASKSGATTPGIDMSSSMAHNHTILQSLPEAARHNYNQIMAAAAQAAQAAQTAHQKKNNIYQDATKTGAGDPSNAEEERKAMASRAASAASVGQSIAFSRDLAENSISTMPGNNVVDTSARSLNLLPGSAHPTRSSGPNTVTNSQQQQQQMLFPKQQQFVAATVAAARSKNPATSNGTVYTDNLTSSSVMAAKFPNALPGFPALVQTSGAPSQSPQWKNSRRPNTSQVSSPPVANTTSTTSTIKNLPQQQGRPQQSHTQISFGAAASNPKQSQGQLNQNSNRAPSPPMRVGSPSTSSMSKSAGGSPRTATSTSGGNKAGPQASTLSNQQGKNSPSPSISSQKPSILGSPHMMSTTSSASKSQLQESSNQQQQLPKQSIQQGQLFFNAYTSAGGGFYLQRHRSENHHHHQQQASKPQGSAPPTSSSGMFSLCTPVSLANASTTCTSDPAKAVSNSMKGGSLPPQGMFQAAQFAAGQSGGGTHQLLPPGFPYVHAVPTVKPADQKQPAA